MADMASLKIRNAPRSEGMKEMDAVTGAEKMRDLPMKGARAQTVRGKRSVGKKM